jgi:hypothetical protein
MKYGRSLVDLATELERQLATKQDMIVPTPLMHHVTSESGSSVLNIETSDGVRTFRTTENCRRQLADRLKIPYAYFERMRAEQPSLLDRNIDTWLHSQPEQRMVRTLDGNARAFLSDRYRRLDNYDLLAHVYPMLRELPGARVESCEVTDSRMYLKVVTSRVQFELQPGDVVHAGVVISNSETGQGSLSVSPLIFRLLCSNGLIAADQAMRKTHIGRMTETSPDEVTFFKEDTLAADDAAFFLKVRDTVQAAVSQATFSLIAERMRKTMGIKLVGDPVKSVERLAVKYLLQEHEKAGVLRALIKDGDLTGFGLVNAVTGYAQEVDLYDRSTELEAIGGRLLDQGAKEWSELAEAA